MVRTFATHPPACPFCDAPLQRPSGLEPARLGNFEYGTCTCGAIFVHDITGYNLGAAMIEALGLACKDDWDLAWGLVSGEDYEDVLLENYDLESHMVHPSGRTQEGRRVRGALFFIRLKSDIRQAIESASGKVVSQHGHLAAIRPEKPHPRLQFPRNRRFTKQEVADLVMDRDVDLLTGMALQDPTVLRKIERLLYAPDETRWNAILTLGGVAGGIATHRPSLIGDLVRRLVYATNDSAAASWGAVETLGEIIRALPDLYGSFLRHILAYLKEPTLRVPVLWAVARIGELHPQLVRANAFFAIFDLLDDRDPDVRGHAVWALGRIKAREALSKIRSLTKDAETAIVFDGQTLVQRTVADLAAEAVERIERNEKPDQKENAMTEYPTVSGTEEGTRLAEARAISREAIILLGQGMSLDALQKLEKAFDVFESEGSIVDIANTAERIGDIHVMRGNIKAAVPVYQRALAVCEKAGDNVSSVILMEKIIDLYRAQKENDKALPYFFRALEIVEKLGDAPRSVFYLTGIGDHFQRAGELTKALDAYRIAHKICRGMGARERAEILGKGIAKIEKDLAGFKDSSASDPV